MSCLKGFKINLYMVIIAFFFYYFSRVVDCFLCCFLCVQSMYLYRFMNEDLNAMDIP